MQFFNLPVNCLNEEGFHILGKEVGKPMSRLVGLMNGRRFHKMKIRIKVEDLIKDKVTFTHPSLGPLIVLCCYGKVSRICRFCGHIGHEQVNCPDYLKISALMLIPENKAWFNADTLLAPIKGACVASSAMLPRESHSLAQVKTKRPHSESVQSNIPTGLMGPNFNMEDPKQALSDPNYVICSMSNPSPEPFNNQLSLNKNKKPRPAGQNAPAGCI